MTSLGATMVLAVLWTATAGQPACNNPNHHHHEHAPAPSSYPVGEGLVPQTGCSLCAPGGRIVAPGPGYGWGYMNGNPDGYGWVDYGSALPLGGDRTTDYFFRRQFATLPQQMFFPTYYNSYLMRGQRFIPYAGCGGDHPFGGEPVGSSSTPFTPAQDRASRPTEPSGPVPVFNGRIEAPATDRPTPADTSASRTR